MQYIRNVNFEYNLYKDVFKPKSTDKMNHFSNQIIIKLRTEKTHFYKILCKFDNIENTVINISHSTQIGKIAKISNFDHKISYKHTTI